MQRLLLSGALVCAMTFGGIAFARAQDSGNVLGTVTRGNTTIVFERANSSDIAVAELHAWQNFADNHPAIARHLGARPALIKNRNWIKKHSALNQFFSEHPQVLEAMRRNSGNFVAPTIAD